VTSGPSVVRAVALVGPRAAGKSTVGRLLAARLGFSFVDGDDLLAAAAGRPAGEHLAAVGEPAFRRLEAQVTVGLLEAADAAVVALGGGAVTIDAVRQALRRPGLFVAFVHAPPAVLAARLRADAGRRPPLTGLPIEREVEALLALRLPLYAEVAHARFDSAATSPAEVAAAIAGALTTRS
jgi:shikimate kinase